MKNTEKEWVMLGELDDLRIVDELGDQIAVVKGYDTCPPNYDESLINAKLIAAAPDLLRH